MSVDGHALRLDDAPRVAPDRAHAHRAAADGQTLAGIVHGHGQRRA